MAETYEANSDDSIVTKTTAVEIDLDDIIDEFVGLRGEYQALPGTLQKTVPDAETLAFWNAEQELLNAGLVFDIRHRATILKTKIDPIRDAGLLPARFEDEYQQLVNFINS